MPIDKGLIKRTLEETRETAIYAGILTKSEAEIYKNLKWASLDIVLLDCINKLRHDVFPDAQERHQLRLSIIQLAKVMAAKEAISQKGKKVDASPMEELLSESKKKKLSKAKEDEIDKQLENLVGEMLPETRKAVLGEIDANE